MNSDYAIKLKLKDILKKKNMTQKQLAELTGIRESTISKLARGEGTGINYYHLNKLIEVLEVKKISDIIDFSK